MYSNIHSVKTMYITFDRCILYIHLSECIIHKYNILLIVMSGLIIKSINTDIENEISINMLLLQKILDA